MRRLALLPLAAIAIAAPGCGQDHPAGGRTKGSGDEVVLTPQAAEAARRQAKRDDAAANSKAKVVQLQGAGAQPKATGDPNASGISPGAQSDAEVRAELKEARAELKAFSAHLTTADLQTGPRAKVLSDGTAVAPRDAPRAVKRVILAGNEIAKFPYKWGGGHGAWRDNGYDCSGSVSFALAGAGLLDRPLTSGLFSRWGDEGPGDWITIYANGGHVFMLVAGLRFDTSGQGRAGTRWQPAGRPAGGFAVRHPPGY
jgi:cell wall-associated NlpC family hydrolase